MLCVEKANLGRGVCGHCAEFLVADLFLFFTDFFWLFSLNRLRLYQR